MSPTEDSEVGKKILSRFSAQFARQLSTKLRITKDNLVLQEKVGSGIYDKTVYSFIQISVSVVGRCYEAEICSILLLLMCSFRLNHFPLKSFFGRKPWTIRSPWFDFWRSKKSLEIRIPSERASQGEHNATISAS